MKADPTPLITPVAPPPAMVSEAVLGVPLAVAIFLTHKRQMIMAWF